MDSAELKLTLKKMIIDECDKDMEPTEIADDEQLIGGRLDLDSLDALQISMWVQKNYGIRIENGPVARRALGSVNSLAQHIQSESASLR
ncbi:phosphopantetheine-binding protein [Gilvimarinus sp. F26214L]|uniref:phosphopantetheine-binding protein n=1 Tax=Gilvimarinus sp. DZF01 TaxID=3461371 RepID=UPI004045A1AE